MKHIKSYKIFEHQNQSLDNSELIRKLEELNIKNYTINIDGTIDVDGDVYLPSKDLTKIPFNFGKVTGYFICSKNKLTSLVGCPKEVDGSFDCSNNNLKDLIGGPQEVGGYYYCNGNSLESLEGCAGDIGGDLICRHNQLKMLDCSSVINGDIYCRGNEFKEEPEFFGVCGGEIKWKD